MGRGWARTAEVEGRPVKVAELFAELGIDVDLAAFAAADARLAQTEAHAALFTDRMRSHTTSGADSAAQAAQMIGLNADSAIAAMQEKSIARAKRWKAGITRAVKGVTVAAFAGYAFVQAVKGVAGLGDSYNAAASKVRMLTDDTEKQVAINRELFRSAQETATGFGAVTSLYQQVGKAAIDSGRSMEQGAAIVDTINKAIKAGGTPAAGAEAALVQLSQGLGSGKLRGEEFNSVLEQAPFLIDIIAKDLGKTRGEMRALANAGKLTSKVVLDALERQKGAVDEAFGRRIPLITDEFTRMRNEVEKTFGELLQDKEVATAFQGALRGLTRALVVTVRGFAAAAVFFSRHQKLFLALISGLTAAFLVLMYQAGATWLAIAGPVALAIAAIALLAFHWEDLAVAFFTGFMKIGEGFDALVRKIQGLIRRLVRMVLAVPGQIGNAIKSGFRAAFDYVHGLLDRLIARLNSIGKEIKKKGPIGALTDALGLPGLSDLPGGSTAKEFLKRTPGVGAAFGGNPFGLAGEGIDAVRSFARGGGGPVSVGPTTVNVTSNKADPVAVAQEVRNVVGDFWNERMRETAESVG
jgi:tape measure domain-containing protein